MTKEAKSGPGVGETTKPTAQEVVGSTDSEQPIVIRVEAPKPPAGRRWLVRALGILLVVSVFTNVTMYSAYNAYFSDGEPPLERYRSGSRTADGKIAVIEISGTIMPPYTERYLRMIEQAGDDDSVRGILLVVDSPGGLVADSHQIYHALVEMRETTEKPIVVSMKRMAASGGLYVAMAAGPGAKIFAEPTTWTGSIGVIVPHYDLSAFGEKHGIGGTHPALKTGEFKDSLNPLRPISERDAALWRAILDDSFQRFLGVIADNRDTLDKSEVEALATGQVYTANQAKDNGLVDEIGFEKDALEALEKEIGAENLRVVTYGWNTTLLESLMGSVEATEPQNQWRTAMESTVPRAMYFCSWAPFYVSQPR